MKAVAPRARVVVLTSAEEEDRMIDAMRAGAQGYLLKTEGATAVLDAIRAAYRGEVALAPRVARLPDARAGPADGPPGRYAQPA